MLYECLKPRVEVAMADVRDSGRFVPRLCYAIVEAAAHCVLGTAVPAVAARPDAQGPSWLHRMCKQGGSAWPRNVRGMPATIPLRNSTRCPRRIIKRLFDSMIGAAYHKATFFAQAPLSPFVRQRKSGDQLQMQKPAAAIKRLRDSGEARPVSSVTVSSDGYPPGSDSEP